jgi:hypothetical protein
MAVYITLDCINCGACEPECPTNAIIEGTKIFEVVPDLCTECVGAYDHHACQAVCPVECCIPNPSRIEDTSVLQDRATALGNPSTRPSLIDAARAAWEAPESRDRKHLLAMHSKEHRQREQRRIAEEAARAEANARATKAIDRLEQSWRPDAWKEALALAAIIEDRHDDTWERILDRIPDTEIGTAVRCINEMTSSLPHGLVPLVARAFDLGLKKGDEAITRAAIPNIGYAKLVNSLPTAIRASEAVGHLVFDAISGIDGSSRWERRWQPQSQSSLFDLASDCIKLERRNLAAKIVKHALGKTPRRAAYQARQELKRREAQSPGLKDVVTEVLREAPSSTDMLRGARLVRVEGSRKLYDLEQSEYLQSLYQLPWDPDEPRRSAAEAKSIISELPLGVVSGKIHPEQFNPYNNNGIKWTVVYDRETGEAEFTLDSVAGAETYSLEDVASLEDAKEATIQAAQEQQDLADENTF